MYSKRNHYDVLNLKQNCTTDDVRQSFAKLSKQVNITYLYRISNKSYNESTLQYHPDTSKTGNQEQNARKFQEIMEAYRVLSKKSSRDAYDLDNSPYHPEYQHYASPFMKRRRERQFYEGDFNSWQQQNMYNQRYKYNNNILNQ